jgi:hypothetical protein
MNHWVHSSEVIIDDGGWIIFVYIANEQCKQMCQCVFLHTKKTDASFFFFSTVCTVHCTGWAREVTVHRPIRYHNLIWITYIRLGYMSSESVCAPWCWTHKRVRLRVLCDIRRSIFGVIVFLPLRDMSLTLPRANVRFSQSSSVALRSGALLTLSLPN